MSINIAEDLQPLLPLRYEGALHDAQDPHDLLRDVSVRDELCEVSVSVARHVVSVRARVVAQTTRVVEP